MRGKIMKELVVAFLLAAGSASLIADPVPATGHSDYLGQQPPGWTPRLFAPGLVSTGLSEQSAPVFSPDGREVLFHVADNEQHVILRLRKVDGRWTGPEVAPFSGLYSDQLPVYSPDGTKIYFRSRRPLVPGAEPVLDFHSWVVVEAMNGVGTRYWGKPRRYSGFDRCAIGSFAADGTLYCSSEVEGEGGNDLFRAEPRQDSYGEPVGLGLVNTSGDELRPSVAPDECCLLFQSGSPRSGPSVSFRGPDDRWSEGRSLRRAFDVRPRDSYPAFSPDGAVVFFVGWRFDWRDRLYRDREEPLRFAEIMDRLEGPQNLSYDIYWLDAAVLQPLRPEADLTLEGDYLGQKPPGLVSEIFAPGLVSTGVHEHSGANFSTDGNELFFVAAGAVPHTLIRMQRQENRRWTPPEVAPFSGRYLDDCPSFTPDGQRLYFQSRRPRDGGREQEETWGIWYVERTEGGWTEPKPDQALTAMKALTPSYARNGNVYFARRGEGGEGRDPYAGTDIYMAQPLAGGGYAQPRPLGPSVNSSSHLELWLFIHPDEDYLLFSSYGRPTGDGLFVSFRDDDGSWSPARWLGQDINGGGQARMPRLSPDGKYLFFNRSGRNRYPDHSATPLTYESLMARTLGPRNGLGDIWWVDVAVLDEVRELEHPDIRQAMLDAIDRNGVEAAIELYHQLEKRHPTYYDFGEELLDQLGAELLESGQIDDAIELLELNVEIFPKSANLHGSLAEAYLKAGDKKTAIDCWFRALAMRPNMPSAIRRLRTLISD